MSRCTVSSTSGPGMERHTARASRSSSPWDTCGVCSLVRWSLFATTRPGGQASPSSSPPLLGVGRSVRPRYSWFPSLRGSVEALIINVDDVGSRCGLKDQGYPILATRAYLDRGRSSISRLMPRCPMSETRCCCRERLPATPRSRPLPGAARSRRSASSKSNTCTSATARRSSRSPTPSLRSM